MRLILTTQSRRDKLMSRRRGVDPVTKQAAEQWRAALRIAGSSKEKVNLVQQQLKARGVADKDEDQFFIKKNGGIWLAFGDTDLAYVSFYS